MCAGRAGRRHPRRRTLVSGRRTFSPFPPLPICVALHVEGPYAVWAPVPAAWAASRAFWATTAP